MYKYGETEPVKVVERKKAEKLAVICDGCKKEILPQQYDFKENKYVSVSTYHRDWGNDSVDSYERYQFCVDCATKHFLEYFSNSEGTEQYEAENKYLNFNEYEYL